MSAKLSLLNLHLRLLPSKVESFIDKTKKEFKEVVNRDDCSEEDVPLDFDLIFSNPRVDLYSFDMETTQNEVMNDPESMDNYDDSKKQKKKTMYNRVKKRIIDQLSKDKMDKIKSKEPSTSSNLPSNRVTLVKGIRVHVYCDDENVKL
ncbi:uncharacterized protein OCT59_003351 [Rhizophagus irregularis]|uniref:Uncharacterized protein n=2 Tax=Rhizophagus irregularis TaxID=588596 RepID=A0A915YXM8_9GLOM|nr:hypothetical protein RirG_186220 [Rhizophagus irregularis DAOM 197198w]UZO11795.1 hypothetical protein OCT59_003351 [Rhizophagus irregularis]GBC37271.1 hypothetical protein RIR_jg29496.t1 [Rhizophagus irregularis DAOM 181602=DAOM 197198]CAB4383894.1 unnamed protein product [Rhizophagus irregularis]CAB4485863.1 unnamed protein product [Rhizophagus irregularis]